MRRRKPVMLTPEGAPWDGVIPEWALRFRAEEWPGDRLWERWDRWWEACREWADCTCRLAWMTCFLR